MIKNIKIMKTLYSVFFASFHFYTIHHSTLTFYMPNSDYGTIQFKRSMLSLDKIRAGCYKGEKYETKQIGTFTYLNFVVFFMNFPISLNDPQVRNLHEIILAL